MSPWSRCEEWFLLPYHHSWHCAVACLLAPFQEICLRLALPLLLSCSQPFFLTPVLPLHTVLNSLCPLPNAQMTLGRCFPGMTQSVPHSVIVMGMNLVSVIAET